MAALRRDFGCDVLAPYTLSVLAAVVLGAGLVSSAVFGRALIETEYIAGRRDWAEMEWCLFALTPSGDRSMVSGASETETVTSVVLVLNGLLIKLGSAS